MKAIILFLILVATGASSFASLDSKPLCEKAVLTYAKTHGEIERMYEELSTTGTGSFKLASDIEKKEIELTVDADKVEEHCSVSPSKLEELKKSRNSKNSSKVLVDTYKYKQPTTVE